jgi:putative glutamine amidotransferase
VNPLIGITCSRVVGRAWGLYSQGHFTDYTFNEYSAAIRDSGGAPVLIPVAQSAETLETILGRVDGLLLSGGPDIHPRAYGEQPLEGLGEVDEGLDRMELKAAAAALRNDLPCLPSAAASRLSTSPSEGRSIRISRDRFKERSVTSRRPTRRSLPM